MLRVSLGGRSESGPRGNGPQTHQKPAAEFCVADRTRNAGQQAFEVINPSRLTIHAAEIQMATHDGKSVTDIFRSYSLRENLLRLSSEGE